jgi:hypothetical protein
MAAEVELLSFSTSALLGVNEQEAERASDSVRRL